MNFHYLVATQQGIEHFTERHELGLFSHEDYLDAFHASEMDVVFDASSDKLMERGVYIGIPR
jgi:hypothetical protein